MITGKNFIGYTAAANTSNPFLSTIPDSGNTATPCSFYEATAAEINAAATLAGQAFSIYRQKSPAQKIDFLEKIAAQIAAQKDELVAMAMHETHLPKPRLDGVPIPSALSLAVARKRASSATANVSGKPMPTKPPVANVSPFLIKLTASTAETILPEWVVCSVAK